MTNSSNITSIIKWRYRKIFSLDLCGKLKHITVHHIRALYKAALNPMIHNTKAAPFFNSFSHILGVHSQKQESLKFVGLHIPVGRLQAEDMLELARLADEYGTHELRLTVEQNLIIPNVPMDKIEALLEERMLKTFCPCPPFLMSTLVACTGNQFYGQAIIETKARALKVTEELDRTMNVPRVVRMHWTGCPNTCEQVQVADIGFMGCMTRDENKKPCEGVPVFLEGRVGADTHLGKKNTEGNTLQELGAGRSRHTYPTLRSN